MDELIRYAKDETTPLNERWYWAALFLLEVFARLPWHTAPSVLVRAWDIKDDRMLARECNYQAPVGYAARAILGVLRESGPNTLLLLANDVREYYNIHPEWHCALAGSRAWEYLRG